MRTLPAGTRTRGARLDLVGALVATAALGLLVYGLVGTGERGLFATTSWGPLALAAALLVILTRHEGRLPDPLLPAALVRSRAVVAANLTALTLTAATTPAMFLSILYVQQVLRFSPARASMLFPAFNVAVIFGSLGGPQLLRGIGARRTLVTGFLGIGAGAALLVALPTAGAAVWQLLTAFALMGAGLGAASVASTHTGTEAAEPAHRGVAAGMLSSAAQVGTVLGLAVVVPLATRGGSPSPDGFRNGFLGACAIAGAGVLVSLLAGEGRPPHPGAPRRWSRPRRRRSPDQPFDPVGETA
jgi:MFS family permease